MSIQEKIRSGSYLHSELLEAADKMDRMESRIKDLETFLRRIRHMSRAQLEKGREGEPW